MTKEEKEQKRKARYEALTQKKHEKIQQREEAREVALTNRLLNNPKFKARYEYYLSKHSVDDITFEDYLQKSKGDNKVLATSFGIFGFALITLFAMFLPGLILNNIALWSIGACVFGITATSSLLPACVNDIQYNDYGSAGLNYRYFVKKYFKSDRFQHDLQIFKELKKDKQRYKEFKNGTLDFQTYAKMYEEEHNAQQQTEELSVAPEREEVEIQPQRRKKGLVPRLAKKKANEQTIEEENTNNTTID